MLIWAFLSFFLLPFLFYFFLEYAYLFLVLGSLFSMFCVFSEAGVVSYSWFSVGSEVFFISLNNDAIARQLVLLVNGIGGLVALYSRYYIRPSTFRYWLCLSFFMGSMQGLLLSHHVLLTFVFWELVGITSFLLIGYEYEKPEAVYGSSKALWVNKIGDVGFWIGIMGLWSVYGSFDLGDWLEKGHLEGAGAWWWLFLLGALAKSAQGPFMIWLPGAMAGPTPISALIHAATMVAAGIYWLFRCHPLLSEEIHQGLAFIGSLTAVLGAVYALFQYRLKAILAGSTLSQLGWMLTAVSSAFPHTAIQHLWAHAFFKAGLFLAAGILLHQQQKLLTKSQDYQDIRLMGYVYKQHPVLYVLWAVLFSALMGVPFTSAFWTKEAILSSQDGASTFYMLLGSEVLTVWYSLKVLYAFASSGRAHPTVFPIDRGFLFPVVVLCLGSFGWILMVLPNEIKRGVPETELWLSGISVAVLIGSALIFWLLKERILNLTSSVVQSFWGLERLYALWLGHQGFAVISIIETNNIRMVDHFKGLLGKFSRMLSGFERGIDGIIRILQRAMVTGKWMGMPFSVAAFFQWLDLYVWDFGIMGLAMQISKTGQWLAQLHKKSIQVLLWYSLFLMVAGGLLLKLVGYF